MKIEEQTNAPDKIIEEATDELGASDSQESADDWTPEELSAEDRARYDAAVEAVDGFIEQFPRYQQTDKNREKILAFLADHSLEISPAALALAYEQLESELELAPEQDSEQPQEEQSDASARLATYASARGTKGVESEQDAEESEPEEPKTARGKPVAWRNGKRVFGVGS